MIALLAMPVLGRVVLGWLWAAPTTAHSPLAALLLAAASTPSSPHVLGPAALGPIVVAAIATIGTVFVAWFNTRSQRAAPLAPEPPADDAALTLDGRMLVLETLFASMRSEQKAGLEGLERAVDRLCQRFEDHLDRGTGRVPAQRRPPEG